MPPALIGRSRAIEMLVNVVLPIAAATGDSVLSSEARALYARLPRAASYGKTKFIENALASMEMPLRINARRAQGLLELERNWCTQNGCGRCSLSAPPSVDPRRAATEAKGLASVSDSVPLYRDQTCNHLTPRP
jgi:hypothetical protein